MNEKTCILCNETKTLEQFHMKYSKITDYCEDCFTSTANEKRKAKKVKYRIEHREKYLQEKKRYAEKHKENIKEYQRQYRHVKLQSDDNSNIFDIDNYLHKKIPILIHGVSNSYLSFFLGCSVQDFKKYIESLFKEGMTWDNYGIGSSNSNLWQLDHYVPSSYFNKYSQIDMLICWNYKNLQPLWTYENSKKCKTLPTNYIEHIDNIKNNILNFN